MARFRKETRHHLLGSIGASVSFEFHRFVLICEEPHRRLLLHLRGVLIYPGFVSCYNVQMRGDLPSPNILSTFMRLSILPPLLLFTQPMGHPIDTKFPYAKAVVRNAIFIAFISAYVIFAIHLTTDSTLEVFSGVTFIAIQPKRSSYSNPRARHEVSEPHENSDC